MIIHLTKNKQGLYKTKDWDNLSPHMTFVELYALIEQMYPSVKKVVLDF